MKEGKNRKKRVAAIVAVACLALVGGLALYAWLTAQSGLTNNFSTDGIYDPTTDPDNPGEELTDDPTKVDGNLTETKWNEDAAKLTAGYEIPKNPNVGLGRGSEDAYVYVYVRNNLMADSTNTEKGPYFILNEGWEAVKADDSTLPDGVGAVPYKGTNAHTGSAYVSGLFVYKGTGENATAPAILTASKTNDVWTGELFSHVYVPDNLGTDSSSNKTISITADSFAEKPTMTVNSFVYAVGHDSSDNSNVVSSGAGSAANAKAQAIEWASDLNQGNVYTNTEGNTAGAPTDTTSTTTGD